MIITNYNKTNNLTGVESGVIKFMNHEASCLVAAYFSLVRPLEGIFYYHLKESKKRDASANFPWFDGNRFSDDKIIKVFTEIMGTKGVHLGWNASPSPLSLIKSS